MVSAEVLCWASGVILLKCVELERDAYVLATQKNISSVT